MLCQIVRDDSRSRWNARLPAGPLLVQFRGSQCIATFVSATRYEHAAIVKPSGRMPVARSSLPSYRHKFSSSSTTATQMGVVLFSGLWMSTIGVRAYCRLLPFGESQLGCREDARLQGHPRKFGDRLNTKLRRDRGAMQFHSSLVDAKIGGDLLIEPALDDMGEYLEFPFAESIKLRAQLILPGTGLAFARIPSKGTLHSVEDLFLRRALF
jgi:hypothetical protein